MLVVELVPAAFEHLPSIRELLSLEGLPLDGLEDHFPAGYVVAHQSGVAGVGGLERHGDFGLLRSVVVAERFRSSGLGRLLVDDRLNAAGSLGIQRVFLLTTTAAAYFEKLGFTPTERAAVPTAITASVEFARACPASATCLSIPITIG